MEADIARFHLLEMSLDKAMEFRQLVEGNARIGVVLGMIGHIPGELADQKVGEGGPAVFKHVRNIGAAAMLGQQIEPEKGLPDERWNEPGKDEHRCSEIEGKADDD